MVHLNRVLRYIKIYDKTFDLSDCNFYEFYSHLKNYGNASIFKESNGLELRKTNGNVAVTNKNMKRIIQYNCNLIRFRRNKVIKILYRLSCDNKDMKFYDNENVEIDMKDYISSLMLLNENPVKNTGYDNINNVTFNYFDKYKINCVIHLNWE